MVLSTIDEQERYYIKAELLNVLYLCYSKDIPNEISMLIYGYAKTHILQKNLNTYLQIVPIINYKIKIDTDIKVLRKWEKHESCHTRQSIYYLKTNKINGSGKNGSFVKKDIQYNQMAQEYNELYLSNVNKMKNDMIKHRYMEIHTGRMYGKRGMEQKMKHKPLLENVDIVSLKKSREELDELIIHKLEEMGIVDDLEDYIYSFTDNMYSAALSKRKSIQRKNNDELTKVARSKFKVIIVSKSNSFTNVSSVFNYRCLMNRDRNIPTIYRYPGEFLSSLEAEENINKYGEFIAPKGISF
tara:strand:+ start:43 stop:939 length:897 start_codon:yes stop_codon:yes gene_type:complete